MRIVINKTLPPKAKRHKTCLVDFSNWACKIMFESHLNVNFVDTVSSGWYI